MADSLPYSAQGTTTERGSPLAIVDALKAMAGNLPHARASFAKGHCMKGRYEPSSNAGNLTNSVNFTRAGAVLGRFSVGGGNPKVPDTNNLVLRGFSFRIETDGVSSDLLFESAPVHFARTLDQMLQFLKARAPAADGKPDPATVKAFSEANPETLNQAKYVAARALPASFATTTYWAVHAFPVTNAQGTTRYVKLKVVPVDGESTLGEEEAKTKSPDFLFDDIVERIRGAGVRFDVVALLDRPGDPLTDLTVRWPDEDNREAVVLGHITIDPIEEVASCDATIFDPSNLAEGVGQPPDELFAARAPAYRISLAKRQA